MTRALRLTAAGLGVLAVALYSCALTLSMQVASEDVVEGAIWGTSFLLLGLIGAVIAFRRPRNRIGWLLLLAGMGEICAGAATLYGEYAAASGVSLPGSVGLAWVGGSLWAFSTGALLVLLPLYFPTGKPPSPRWRWVGWLGGAGVVLLLAGTVDIAIFRPELMSLEWEAVEAAAGKRPLFAASELGFPLLLGAAPFAFLSLVVRFVRSHGEERQQIKLLVFAVGITVAFILTINLIEVPRVMEAAGTAIALPSVGVATMIAVLRYRLFEIDRIVSRTLTYGLVTVLLAVIYVVAVTLLTTATAPLTRRSPLAVAAATLITAAAFQPTRRRIQSLVDRRFNRARYDARRTVEHFASSLRQEVDIDDVHSSLVSTVDEVLQPASVVVWLRSGGAA